MGSTTCPQEECNRIFEKPVAVTNFSFSPKKTYSACPYCLTRINLESKKSNLNCNPPEKPNSITFDLQTPQKNALEKIKNLEQEKTHLITELEELRKAATEKINCLENDVIALREEAKILKKLTNR